MKEAGKLGEYTLIQEGLWYGIADANGNVLISPELHYRTINKFEDGVSVALQQIGDRGIMMWGLIDSNGNHLCEFKYNFVEPWGEGYYRCDIGNKSNLLRKDGSEVLGVWFNGVGKVQHGVFFISNTIKKTKDHPTLYPKGLASVNGDILFPPIFSSIRWNDEVILDYLLAEKDGKTYIVTASGLIIDVNGDHLPKTSNEDPVFTWNGPKHRVCDGCIFTSGINERGEGCGKLPKDEFRQRVIRGHCEHYKKDEQQQSFKEKMDDYSAKKEEDRKTKQVDTYAKKLVRDFIQDKLDNDIMKLESFDFNTLNGDEKYGNCGGFAFTPEKTNIVKAIASLTFTEAWPELLYDGLDHYEYEVAQLNTYRMFLGFPLGDTFSALRDFRPSVNILDRATHFFKLCHSIGNYIVWPGGITACREQLRRNQRYTDTYLKAIYLAIINDKKCDSNLLKAINHRKKAFEPYRSENGFDEMCKKMYLADYLDYMGGPMELFDGVWFDQKDLSRDYFFKAMDQYFEFCERAIVRRSKQIAKRLMQALDMTSPVVEEDAILTLHLPEDYAVLRALPDDPEGAISYSKETPTALCFVQTYPIDIKETMPMDNARPIIDGIHNSLGERQGLIEAVVGKTQYNKQVAYSIVKTVCEPSGVSYILTMHLVKNDKALCLKGQFDERGTTGIREATVLEYAQRKEPDRYPDKDWIKDPYDPKFTKGIPMNYSESRQFDFRFPEHPLTLLRKMIHYIAENN